MRSLAFLTRFACSFFHRTSRRITSSTSPTFIMAKTSATNPHSPKRKAGTAGTAGTAGKGGKAGKAGKAGKGKASKRSSSATPSTPSKKSNAVPSFSNRQVSPATSASTAKTTTPTSMSSASAVSSKSKKRSDTPKEVKQATRALRRSGLNECVPSAALQRCKNFTSLNLTCTGDVVSHLAQYEKHHGNDQEWFERHMDMDHEELLHLAMQKQTPAVLKSVITMVQGMLLIPLEPDFFNIRARKKLEDKLINVVQPNIARLHAKFQDANAKPPPQVVEVKKEPGYVVNVLLT